MLEFWQADASGRYGANGAYGGWARRAVDPEAGRYLLETILTAATGDEAAHVKVWVVARHQLGAAHTNLF